MTKLQKTVALSKALITQIEGGVKKGLPVRVYAASLGIPVETLNRWLNEGRKQLSHMLKEGTYAPNADKHEWMCYELALAVDKAAAQAFIKYHNKINNASSRDWKAAMALLDRFFAEYKQGGSASGKASIAGEGGRDPDAVPTVKVIMKLPDNGRGPKDTK